MGLIGFRLKGGLQMTGMNDDIVKLFNESQLRIAQKTLDACREDSIKQIEMIAGLVTTRLIDCEKRCNVAGAEALKGALGDIQIVIDAMKDAYTP
jgi:hypothetical protein